MDATSSSAERRPPVRFEMVPPVATSRTRGVSWADATVAQSNAVDSVAMARRRLLRGQMHVGMERIQMPVEERPDTIPGVTLLARVLRLPRLRIDATVERVASRGVVVHYRFGQRRLPRAQRVHQLHVFFDVHVFVVLRNADVE